MKRLTILLSSVLLVVGLTGCGDGGSLSNGKFRENISIGLTLAPTNLDIRNTSGAALEQVLLDNVYEGLVTINEAQEVVPSLAKSWVISDDTLTYTFVLEPGITFSDATPVSAQTIADSINDVLANQLKDFNKLGSIVSVEAKGELDLQIILSEPYVNLLWYLGGRTGIAYQINGSFDHLTEARGTGPYLVEEFKENESITLVKNPSYWKAAQGTEATTDTIVFQYISDSNAALNALMADNIQILAPLVENLLPTIESNEDFNYAVADGTDKFTLAFNNTDEILKSKNVRVAIRKAIDHQALINARGGKADLPLYGPIPKIEPGYQDLSKDWTYDPDKAKELLKVAKQENPTLTLKYANQIYGDALGDLLKSQLAEVGITLEIVPLDFTTWLNDVYTNKNYQLTIVDQANARDFVNFTNADYYYNYSNPQVNELYQQSQRAHDVEAEAKLLAEAAKIVSDDSPVDWLFNYRTIVAYREGMTGFPMTCNQTRLNLVNVKVPN
ncbi:MAG: ABC transporter substrate-binding protein [Bifidobacteriaceae bacterium]|jgi:peptide/nickel transport system substrate-binding protein|nr:ABC transporter substrate-binding protein [Bifidobacteriaceae bacterium]